MNNSDNYTTWLRALLIEFNKNWGRYHKDLVLELPSDFFKISDKNPLRGELLGLMNDIGGSLPYFSKNLVAWCTLAPDYWLLRQQVKELESWVIPSYAWVAKDDGYKMANPSRNSLEKALSLASSTNYFRWRCTTENYFFVEQKLLRKYKLDQSRPEFSRIQKPALYELRAQFHTALTVGNRTLANKIIEEIDSRELDKALNTLMMRVQLWHHFREFDRIRNEDSISILKNMDALPSQIVKCLSEVFDTEKVRAKDQEVIQKPLLDDDWSPWFDFLENQDPKGAEQFLKEREGSDPQACGHSLISNYTNRWKALYLNGFLKDNYQALINQGLAQFLDEFIRESGFPRQAFCPLYLELFNLWGDINKGVGLQQKEGHVLLELASALFSLNYEVDEVKLVIEEWWRARPVPSQLPYVLDAIELLGREHPDQNAPSELWLDAADLARRNSESLLDSEKVLWKEIGIRIGFDEETTDQYFPIQTSTESDDPLKHTELQRVAIVCMREEQARVASEMIKKRTNAEVILVTAKRAGTETSNAVNCDVVLFVWMATTHAVFRAFDTFDREKLCYVQGTGSSSIVRSLERWCRGTLVS